MANEQEVQSKAEEVRVKPEINLNVDPGTAINLNAMEYDKKISEAEAVVADLKKQKAAYIYDSNVQSLLAQAQAQKQQQNPAPPPQPMS